MSWPQDGCQTLSIEAGADVPTLDDPMIIAVLRGALECDRLASLERTLGWELWRIGYAARIEYDPADRSVVRVEIASAS